VVWERGTFEPSLSVASAVIPRSTPTTVSSQRGSGAYSTSIVKPLAGPIGAAAGGSIAAGTAAGIGAAAGGAVGLTADAVKSREHEEAAFESGFVMKPGQSAVIAEVSEDWTTPVDTAMQRLGGTVFRRDKGTVRDAFAWGGYYAGDLYPYDYEPTFA
jgi:hypothetical protein